MTKSTNRGRGGTRAGAGRPVVWDRRMQVWLLTEYFTLIADGYRSAEAYQVLAFRLKKEHDANLEKRRIPDALKEVQVNDLPAFLRVDMRGLREPGMEAHLRYMATAPAFESIEKWAQYMRDLGKANRAKARPAFTARIEMLRARMNKGG